MQRSYITLFFLFSAFFGREAFSQASDLKSPFCQSLVEQYPLPRNEKIYLFDQPIILPDLITSDDQETLLQLSEISDNFVDYSVRLAWAEILSNIEWKAIGTNDEDEKALKNAIALIFVDQKKGQFSAEYETYSSYKKLYFDTLERFGGDQNNLPDEIAREELASIAEDWELLGQKRNIESALATIERLVNTSNAKLEKLLEESKKTFGTIDKVPAEFMPPFDKLIFAEQGWINLTIDPNVKSSGAAISCSDSALSKPILNVQKPPVRFLKGNFPIQRIELEFTTVSINRNWFVSDLFASSDWVLQDKKIVSSGDLLDPSGILSLLPTRFIVVRNSKYFVESPSTFVAAVRAEVKKTGTFSVLQSIAASGQYDLLQGDQEKARPVPFFGGLSTSFVQIVGVIGSVTPKSPLNSSSTE